MLSFLLGLVVGWFVACLVSAAACGDHLTERTHGEGMACE